MRVYVSACECTHACVCVHVCAYMYVFENVGVSVFVLDSHSAPVTPRGAVL